MAVAAFSRDPSSGNLTFLEMYKDGENGVDGANSAQEIVVSPNDKFVYLISGGDHSLCKNAIACFARDANTGKLTFVSHINWLKATSGGAVSPGGQTSADTLCHHRNHVRQLSMRTGSDRGPARGETQTQLFDLRLHPTVG